jgi:hypothetical protein
MHMYVVATIFSHCHIAARAGVQMYMVGCIHLPERMCICSSELGSSGRSESSSASGARNTQHMRAEFWLAKYYASLLH